MACDAVEALLQFGVAMLRAGNTAARTHEWIEFIARKLTFDSVSVSQSLDSLVITVRGSDNGSRSCITPGVYAFEMIVLFNRGQTVEALQASASCGFVIGHWRWGWRLRAFSA